MMSQPIGCECDLDAIRANYIPVSLAMRLTREYLRGAIDAILDRPAVMPAWAGGTAAAGACGDTAPAAVSTT